jgi:predicted nucleic-acid-binding protein
VTGLDTNVLVRFLVRDDEEQHERVVSLLRRGADAGETFFIGDVVLAEVVWVLASRYRVGRDELAAVVRKLAEVEELHFESNDRVVRALHAFRSGRGGFADYLIAERARDAGCDVVYTFDRALLTGEGFQRP